MCENKYINRWEVFGHPGIQKDTKLQQGRPITLGCLTIPDPQNFNAIQCFHALWLNLNKTFDAFPPKIMGYMEELLSATINRNDNIVIISVAIITVLPASKQYPQKN